MAEITHRTLPVNGFDMHIAEMGEGPLVLLLHGFPECWYTWRHQLRALADAGYHAVAPDQRGMGETGGPDEPEQYTQLHLVGDVVALLTALDEGPVVVVGHDWGSPVASNLALWRPDLVRGLVTMSVPPVPRGDTDTLTTLDQIIGPTNYQRYFQLVGPAEAELDADALATIRRFYWGLSGDIGEPTTLLLPEGGGVLDVLPEPPALPAWLTGDDLDVMGGLYASTGFHRALNWYRASTRTFELTAPWLGAVPRTPTSHITGDKDVVHRWPGIADLVAALPSVLPEHRATVILDGCGHWTGEERPDEVNEAFLAFLSGFN
jgi:pimeloyl-ACP methyl ester carboxylesterase